MRDVRAALQRWVEPAADLRQSPDYPQVRALIGITLAMIGIFTILAVLMAAAVGAGGAGWFALFVPILAALYWLSRGPRYRLAIALLPLILLAATFGALTFNTEPEAIFLVIGPVLIAGLFWSPQALAVLAGISVAGAVRLASPAAQDRHVLALALVCLTVIAIVHVSAALVHKRMDHILGQRTQEIAAAEMRFRAVVENGPDAYYLLHPLRNDQGQISDFEVLDVNTTALDLSELPREKLIGLRVLEQDETTPKTLFDEYCRVVETQQPYTGEHAKALPDGSHLWYEMTGVPVGDGLAVISRDITRRKRSEEFLRESEARFRNMADSAPVLMWVADADKQIHYFNRSWLSFTGHSLEHEAGYGWVEGIHPDDAVACLQTYETSFDARTAYEMIYRLRRSDGVYRWMLERGAPRFTDDHVFLGYMGSAVDITDQKLTEAALRESQAWLQAIVESMPFDFWAMNHDGHYVMQNSESMRLWGNLIERKPDKGRVPAWVIEAWRQNNQEAFTGQRIRKEMHYEAGDQLLHVYNIVVPVRDQDEIIGIAGVNIDIGELKQIEAKLRAILQAIPDFMARIHRDGTYLEVIHGSDFEDKQVEGDIVGRKVVDIIAPESAALRMHSIQQALETGKLQTYEYNMSLPSGALCYLEARVTVSGPDEVLVIVRDITARREAEARALDLALEREQIALLRRFVGDQTHDLMTPVTILKTSLYLLSRASQPERREEHIAKLGTQVDNLENMIRNMLMLLQLDKPVEDEFEFSVQDLNALVERLVADHQPVAISRGLILQFEGRASLPLIAFDAEKMERALANLIDNALKYTPSGGKVLVTTETANHEVQVCIEDTGRGIPDQDLPRIFDRFFRSEHSQSQAGGSGLGLAIVHKIVQAHGGRIAVESEQDKGSRFCVVLPTDFETTLKPA